MYVRYALLADGIVPGAGGKKNIIGTFNTIYSPKFPAQYAEAHLLVRLEAHESEAGSHRMTIDFVDETGTRLSKASKEINFKLSRKSTVQGTPLTVEVVVEIVGLTFPDAGNYDLTIRVDGTYLDSVPLYVRQVEDE